MRSEETGFDFFGTPVPPPEDGYVRINMVRGYHYFKVIDENTTRYMNISNSDP